MSPLAAVFRFFFCLLILMPIASVLWIICWPFDGAKEVRDGWDILLKHIWRHL